MIDLKELEQRMIEYLNAFDSTDMITMHHAVLGDFLGFLAAQQPPPPDPTLQSFAEPRVGTVVPLADGEGL